MFQKGSKLREKRRIKGLRIVYSFLSLNIIITYLVKPGLHRLDLNANKVHIFHRCTLEIVDHHLGLGERLPSPSGVDPLVVDIGWLNTQWCGSQELVERLRGRFEYTAQGELHQAFERHVGCGGESLLERHRRGDHVYTWFRWGLRDYKRSSISGAEKCERSYKGNMKVSSSLP